MNFTKTTPEPVRWIAARHVRGPLAVDRLPRQAAAATWPLIDWVLASPGLSDLTIAAAVLGMAGACVWAGGLTGLVSGVPALSVIWGAVAGLIRAGREQRGVRPGQVRPRPAPPGGPPPAGHGATAETETSTADRVTNVVEQGT